MVENLFLKVTNFPIGRLDELGWILAFCVYLSKGVSGDSHRSEITDK